MKHPDDPATRPSVEARLIIVQDAPQVCPYLPDMTARMPLRLPVGRLRGSTTDDLLARGFRRSGDFVYRTQCPSCSACEPTRVSVADFVWTKSFRRVLKRGDQELRADIGVPQCDAQRVLLFNQHRCQRSLARGEDWVDEEGYRAFLVESCCDTFELSFYREDQLIAVSIIDQARQSLSAVYTYFDPEMARYGLGTYSILKQIELAIQTKRQFLYLGMYVAANSHLNYKARFLPQQRLVNEHWTDAVA